MTGKKNPAREAGCTGYCCCREIGCWCSSEAVVACYCCSRLPLLLIVIFILLFWRLLASMSGGQMSKIHYWPQPFFVRKQDKQVEKKPLY
jgi:hypothetical protein